MSHDPGHCHHVWKFAMCLFDCAIARGNNLEAARLSRIIRSYADRVQMHVH